MPTYRKLHTKIIDSFDFAEMPNDFTRVFWMLLIVTVDSEGRAIDNPAWLRSRMFPLREDIKFSQIEDALTWLYERKMVLRYTVGGRKYFQVVKFKEYQSGTEREAKSVLPAPQNYEPNQEVVKSNSGVGQELPGPAVSVSVNESVNAYASVYEYYEKEIGHLTPMVADDLKLAETEYPPEWAIEAIHEAVKNNARNWKYVLAILKRWKSEGRKPPPQKNGKQKKYEQVETENGELIFREVDNEP